MKPSKKTHHAGHCIGHFLLAGGGALRTETGVDANPLPSNLSSILLEPGPQKIHIDIEQQLDDL